MATTTVQRLVWELAARQHDVVTRVQLLALGITSAAIRHALGSGRLHPVHPGVYAVGRPGLSRFGRWMAAVLACGPEAALSHGTAAALWGIRPEPAGARIHVTVPPSRRSRASGVVVHRREVRRETVEGISLASPVETLVDLATELRAPALERAVNDADRLDLVDPEELRDALDALPRRPGIRALRQLLDRLTFRLTDSELERRFLALVRRAGLPQPLTRRVVNGFRVDFWWPTLGLVVETDGLRYHRTPAQQARDRLRDQVHLAAGLAPLRFTHAQVVYESDHVIATLRRVARRR